MRLNYDSHVLLQNPSGMLLTWWYLFYRQAKNRGVFFFVAKEKKFGYFVSNKIIIIRNFHTYI